MALFRLFQTNKRDKSDPQGRKFGLQFYAAAPLTTKNGYNLGTFCIIDKRQRYINSEQQIMLKQIASIVMDEMEVRIQSRNLVKEYITRLKELKSQ